MQKKSIRLLIFIVAYNAEHTLEMVLERIPLSIFEYDYQILVIDDSSHDRTASCAFAYKERHPEINMEVLRNPENQGYGGNQKIGYQYAIDQGFDIVALLHGDGQYAPEKLEELVGPVAHGEAEFVLGTRMMNRREALKGGMPLYKFLGNILLSSFQNALLKTKLSEFHSGYRVYAVRALREIPFQYNTDDFHFDTEIIIQFLLRGFRIKELPIPTYYGNEICYVNGLKYAWNVVKTTLTSILNRMDIFYERKYDVEGPSTTYELKLGYPSSHTFALAEVPNRAKVLDIGCGEGLLGEMLKGMGCIVHGIDRHQKISPGRLDHYLTLDFDRERIPPLEHYDAVLVLDILEHLNEPERLLDDLRAKSPTEKPAVIISLPNVGFLPVRLRLFFGDFQYGKRGILDMTHRRLFTFRSAVKMLQNCGYKILDVKGVPAPYPKALGYNALSRLLLKLNRALIAISKGLFSYQIFIKATPLLTVSQLLEETRNSSLEFI